MTGHAADSGRPGGSRWRIAGLGSAALLMLLPLLAMQVTDEVNWDGSDFAFAAALILAAGLTFDFAARMTGNRAYRAAVGVALAAAFILVWMNLAVSVIGSEDNPANLMYVGVLAVCIVGALIARFEPEGMARALVATALAQAAVAVIALVFGWGSEGANWPQVIVVLNGFFAALWLISAWLFRKAAREDTPSA